MKTKMKNNWKFEVGKLYADGRGNLWKCVIANTLDGVAVCTAVDEITNDGRHKDTLYRGWKRDFTQAGTTPIPHPRAPFELSNIVCEVDVTTHPEYFI